MAKLDLIIKRPDGLIPGLREVNDILAEQIGKVFMITADKCEVDGQRILIWKSCALVNATDPGTPMDEREDKPIA